MPPALHIKQLQRIKRNKINFFIIIEIVINLYEQIYQTIKYAYFLHVTKTFFKIPFTIKQEEIPKNVYYVYYQIRFPLVSLSYMTRSRANEIQ